LAVTVLFGALSIGVSYAFLYWAILSVPPGLAMIVLALGPLMTFFFAFLHGLERFQWRGLLGAVVALAGIVVGVGGASTRAPLVPVLAIAAGAAAIAEASVLLKRTPRTDPIATNAIALITGAGVLAATSLLAHERWSLPADPSTWGAFIYLVAAGTVVLFFLYLFILDRWSASATSYSFLLFPLVTIVLSSLITGEIITPIYLLGTALVLMGVWLGSLARLGTSARSRGGEQEGQGMLAAEGSPDLRS
jgi:drug/metabolite transporter (DMT)-like permease